MARIAGTPKERRDRYLKLAAQAEANAAKLSGKAKASWVDLAVSWMMMASEMSSEIERSRKHKLGGRRKS